MARTSRRLIHFVTAALFAVVLSPRAGGAGAVSRDPRLGTDEVVVRFKQGV